MLSAPSSSTRPGVSATRGRSRDSPTRPAGAGSAGRRAAVPPRRRCDRRASRNAAIGRVGIAATILGTLVNISVFLAYGTTAAVARMLGAGDLRGAMRQGVDGLCWPRTTRRCRNARRGLASRTLAGIAVRAFRRRRRLCRDLFADQPARNSGDAACPGGHRRCKGLQDTRTPLLVAVAGAVGNVVLNLALVYGLGLGIAGSALGTVIAQAMSPGVRSGGGTRGTAASGSARPDWAGVRPRSVPECRSWCEPWRCGSRWSSQRPSPRPSVRQSWRPTRSRSPPGRCSPSFSTRSRSRPGSGRARAGRRRRRRGAIGHPAHGLVGRPRRRRAGGAGRRDGPAVRAPIHLRPGGSHAPHRGAGCGRAMQPAAGWVFVLDGVLIGAGDGRYLALASVISVAVFLPAAYAVTVVDLSELAGQVALWAAIGVWILARLATRPTASGRSVARHRRDPVTITLPGPVQFDGSAEPGIARSATMSQFAVRSARPSGFELTTPLSPASCCVTRRCRSWL